MKIIKNLTEFRKSSLKTRIVIATAIMGITFVSVGWFNNANYKSSTRSMDENIKVFGSVYTTQYGVTTASALSVRSGAGTNYAVLGIMKSGTKVVITGKTNNFYKVTYNNKTAYMSTHYVKITAKPVVKAAPSKSSTNKTSIKYRTVGGKKINANDIYTWYTQDGVTAYYDESTGKHWDTTGRTWTDADLGGYK
ncbi:SH3 domain-containing protein [Clostridium estertheticum]|nr:SH3 domain-containing protein [Clostridium estertheticum]MBX4265497.1 SH3 domain-containing protein [Clostridium estertheticum]MBX4272141.1 SH3 domain-containing protein [Clostridium estertheticum]WLC82176.1 SH3 domain-containing protein [Clostridium estertheticum]WLC91156.1 SH3 domain-containing protein [Clostridium estertheticum]